MVDSYDSWYHYWGFDYNTEELESGTYQAQMVYNGGPLGVAESSKIGFRVTDPTAKDPVYCKVYSTDGETPAYYPDFEVLDSTGETVFWAEGDDNGKVDITDLDLESGKQYYLLVKQFLFNEYGNVGSKITPEQTVIYWSPISSAVIPDQVDLSTTEYVELSFKSGQTPLNGAAYISLPATNGQIIRSEYAGDMYEGSTSLRVNPGTYDFVFTQGYSYWDAESDETNTLYYLTKDNIKIKADSTESINAVYFDPDDTFTLSVSNEDFNGESGVAIYSPSCAFGLTYPAYDCVIKMSKRNDYMFDHFYSIYDSDGYWGYWLVDEKQYKNQARDLNLGVGGPYNASIKLNKTKYKLGEKLTGESKFTDHYGNRLVEIWVYPWYYEFVLKKAGAVTKNDDNKPVFIDPKTNEDIDMPVNAQTHDWFLAPIFNIYDSKNAKLVHKKYWSQYFEVEHGLGEDKFPEGKYNAEIILGIGPAGPVKAQQPFTIYKPSSGGPGGGSSDSSGSITLPPAAKPLVNMFNDLPNDHWAVNEIVYLAEKNIIGGFPDGTFRPEGNINRAQFAVMIANALKLETQTQEQARSFSDVSGQHWAHNAIQATTKAKIMIGYGKDFRPEQLITREEMAQVIMKALHYAGDIKGGHESTLNRFTDKDQIPEWARSAVAEAVESDIIKGIREDYFGAGTNATRAQATMLIYKVYILRAAK